MILWCYSAILWFSIFSPSVATTFTCTVWNAPNRLINSNTQKTIHFRLWPLLKRTLGVDICAMGCLWTIWCVVLEAVPEIHSFVFNLPWPCLLASVIYTDRCSHLKWIQRSEYQCLKSAMLAKCCCSASKQSYNVIL